ncbi:MAG: IS110 family transposase [Rhizomicrobium sp.]
MTDKPIIGADVSKHWLDLADAGDGGVERIDNSHEAIMAWLSRVQPSLVAFEATGGYERTLQRCLQTRGVLFARVHPNDVVAYRRSRGIRAKTDRIDARLIAAFAADELARRGLKPAIAADETLRELTARRRQLIQTLHAERCRLELADAKAVRASIALVCEAIQASLKAVEAEIAHHLQSQPEARELATLLQTLRGVGPVVATALIADLPEIGHLSAKQIAALVGLAPITRQSGKSLLSRPHRIWTARRATGPLQTRHAPPSDIHRPSRTSTTAWSTTTNDQERVALTAVMRKILVTANAIARDRKPWRAAIA